MALDADPPLDATPAPPDEAPEPAPSLPSAAGGEVNDFDLGGSQAAGAPEPRAAEDLTVVRLRDAAQQYGFDLSGYPDDQAALRALFQQAQLNRQNEVYAQIGRQIAPHAERVSQFLRQPPPSATPAEPARQPWEPPPLDERWLQLVERDPATGVFIPRVPGVPPAIVDAVNERAAWQRQFEENPWAVVAPAIEERARAIADQRIEERFAGYQMQQAAQQIMAQNADWLYQRDQENRLVRGAGGQPVPTAAANRYAQHVHQLERAGVRDQWTLDALARQLLRADMALAAQQQAEPAAAQQAGEARLVPNRNPLQAQPPGQRRRNPAAQEPVPSGLSLREQMAAALAANGVGDDDFQFES